MPIDNFLELLLDEIDGKINYAVLGGMQDGKISLGGTAGSGGGSGNPPGGFIGKLIQQNVTYDTTEALIITTSAVPSLVDNLNHIRYNIQDNDDRIAVLEVSGGGGSGVGTFLELTDTPASFTGHAGAIPTVAEAVNEIVFSGTVARLFHSELGLNPGVNEDFILSKKITTSETAPDLYIETPITVTDHGKIIIRDGIDEDAPPIGVQLDSHTYAEIDDDSTVSFTVADEEDRILVVGVSLRGGRTVSTLTYNGDTLTSAGSQQPGGDVRIEIWYLLAPDVGTYDIAITCSTADDHILFASSYYNVASVGTFVSNGGGASTTASQALTDTYDAAVAVICMQSGNEPSATSGTELDTHSYDSIGGGMAWMIIPDVLSTAWSFGSDYFALGALHLTAETGGAAPTNDNLVEISGTEVLVHKPTVFNASVTISGILETNSGRIVNTTSIDDGDSPYTVLLTDQVIFCQSTSGAITVELPAGAQGTFYKLINCGSGVFDVSVTPDGTESIMGGGGGVVATLSDGEILEVHYDTTEGWW